VNLTDLVPALLFVPPTAALAILTSKREPPYIDPRKGFTEWKGGANPFADDPLATVRYFTRGSDSCVGNFLARDRTWTHDGTHNDITHFKATSYRPGVVPALKSIGAFARALAEKPKRSRAKSSTRKKRAA
jgi:hypothetical protein